MTRTYFKIAGRLASALIAGGLICGLATMPARAQDVSSDQILKALAPPAPVPLVTRSLSRLPAPAAAPTIAPADQQFVESVRGRTRSLTIDEGNRLAELAKNMPKIDLEIYFDYNSAAITPKAEPQLTQLGNALKNDVLRGANILISGHTDAKGGDQYNQQLSERRADAVRAYLLEKFGLTPNNLATAGFGKRQLKNTTDPFAPENRRVEIVNLSGNPTASR